MQIDQMEQEAIEKMKAGDLRALEPLVHRYQQKALYTAYLITGDRDLAEDIVQTSYLRAYQSIQGFDARKPFGPWFLRSVVNASYRAARNMQRHVSIETHEDPIDAFRNLLSAPAPDLQQHVEQLEFQEQMRAALETLSPEQRKAVVLRYFLEMDEREMADALDCPPGTVKWRLHNARKTLRNIFTSS